MMKRQCIATAVGIMLTAGTSVAGPEQVTVQEAVSRGLSQNNLSRAAAFQAEAARSGAKAAALHYLPSLTFEESWTRSNLPVNTFMMKLNQGRFTMADMSTLSNPAPVSDFRTALTLEQPLLAPGAWAGSAVARHGAERHEAVAEVVRQQVAFQVFQHYLEVHKAKAQLTAADKALDEARESARQAGVRTAAGLGLKSDELRAATHLAAMEQQKISAANNLTLARMQLALATGGQPGEELDAGEPLQLKMPKDRDSLVSSAQQDRRDLRAAELGKEQADAAVLQARSGFLPTIGGFASWQMNDSSNPFGHEHDAWAVGVTLRWNIFDGFRTWHGDGQARANRAAAGEQVQQTRKEVSYQVHEAWLRRQEAEKRYQVATAALQSAEETVRLLSKRFDNALASMVELLDAQSALNQARANLVESEANLSLATGRLYHSAGTFLKEVL